LTNPLKQVADSLALLNREQKSAVKSQNKRVLVLAGAGSGKTKTLLQKIVYLIQEKKVKPEEILAITFTKNAADEMIDRLLLSNDTDGFYQRCLEDKLLTSSQLRHIRLQKMREQKWVGKLTIRTFHSFCYYILKTYGAKEFDNKFKLLTDTKADDKDELSKLSADETQIEVLHKMLISCCEEKDFLLEFKRYIIDFMVDRLHIASRAFINDHPEGKYYTSLRGDKVRSKSEQYICDWLYRHNINYVYEPTVFVSEFAFKPDFFIPDANLYLEHISSKSAKMTDKEKEFEVGGKILVKTYEPMTADTNYFNLALTRIVKGRLPASYDFEKALYYEEELNGRHAEVKEFLKHTLRILDMLQVDNVDVDKLNASMKKEQHERVRLFYKCCLPVIEKYKAYCINKSYLDFNELVNRCIALVKNDETVRSILHSQYKFVLVDEFQDVNKIQIQLIKTIMNPEAQLFCVGDDWQSIYGFRGSDVRFIVDFSKYFVEGEVVHLNKNYRSSQNIVNASNEVIKNNKFICSSRNQRIAFKRYK
jgi:DNA helicase IV